MVMSDIKIIFFDIDGTLVDPQTGRISPKTKEALHRLHQKGYLLFIATGRVPASLPDLTGLSFDGFLTMNGSLCYTEHETIYHNPIRREDVQKVMQNAAAIGRPVSVAVRDRLVANGIDRDLADYYRLAGCELTVAEDFEETCKADIYQIMLGCTEAEHPAIVQGANGVKLAISWDRAVDVIPAEGGKGTGIANILSYYHLEPAQALAFGDGLNDIEMLQTAGTGIAMGNAAPALKAVADHMCAPVSEDGIYHYCVEQGLI